MKIFAKFAVIIREMMRFCIVEDVRDVMAIENTAKFNGKYLVLGGKISPMEGIGTSIEYFFH